MTPSEVSACADEARRQGDGPAMARVIAQYLRLDLESERGLGEVLTALDVGVDRWQAGYDEGYDLGKMDAREEIPVEQMQDALKKARDLLETASAKITAAVAETVDVALEEVKHAQKEIDW